MLNHYDYIIAGAGCAGRSLAIYMLPLLAQKNQRLLLLDDSFEHHKAKTWCFWEAGSGRFEQLVYCQWNSLKLSNEAVSIELNTHPYTYKMIRSIDFYQYSTDILSNAPQVVFKTGTITNIEQTELSATVKMNGELYTSNYVFSSLPQNIVHQSGRYKYLLQHFRGWTIKSAVNAFDPGQATLMDFDVPQHKGTAFMYVLPFSTDTAMVEYTVFSENPLQVTDYEEALQEYISQSIGISDFTILAEESGIIPMTDHPMPTRNNKIIYIGTAGGYTKPSTGYTFNSVQKHCQQITNSLWHDNTVILPKSPAGRFMQYDGTLLRVLTSNAHKAPSIFTRLFQSSPPQRIFRFLDNETSIWEEVQIFSSLPKWLFIKAFIQKLITIG